ncbi:DUF896 domain-containing protein [Acetobacterium sp.]|jgi:uncharacterized protein YnzC (UPF0291/DUF896 family)|uniref:DUF896 domain-containing protein n=1 Tax=Acetobacterium sp. TaxID=1872094 RepID=UPI000CAD54AB|nr:DUF896 domain-containing protein [Acetobacterium sp.]MDO9492017.1 DUF896 domain-containing protein [Acetobacterium sp.]PKM73253.1 MAG: DUF896 family protein [Firmicutes bacterium HGW-Firmicutes-17]
MITKENIDRINELARKKKECGLTEDESDEQMTLRAEYLSAIRTNLKDQLDNIEIVDK